MKGFKTMDEHFGPQLSVGKKLEGLEKKACGGRMRAKKSGFNGKPVIGK